MAWPSWARPAGAELANIGPMNARRWQIILVIVLIVVLASALSTLLLRDIVRQYIVLPLSFGLWLISLVVNSIPQSTYWAFLVAIAVWVAWHFIITPIRSQRGAKNTRTITRQVERSRLEERQDLLARMDESRFACERVAFEMRALVVQQIAYQDHQTVDDVERRVRARSLEVPEEVNSLLVDWQHWLADEPADRWERYGRRVVRHFSSGKRRKPDDSRYLRQVERVIDYLETLGGGLEVNRPHPDNKAPVTSLRG